VQAAVLSLFGVYGIIAGLAGGIAHFFIDLLKLYISKYFRRAEFVYFIFDQILHLAVLMLLTWIVPVDTGLPFPIFLAKYSISILVMSFAMSVAARILVRDIFPSAKKMSFFGKNERIYDAAAAIIVWLCWKLILPWSLLADAVLLFPYIYLQKKLLFYSCETVLVKYVLYSVAAICLTML
jgi:hypothetical protein